MANCDEMISARHGGTSAEHAIRLTLIGLSFALVPLSFVDAPYPEELVLQHVPTILALIGLFAVTSMFPLSRLSFLCIVIFLWIHILGARWIYSYVPYDDWAELLVGTTISDQFGWHRNHYDRMVHLASGVLGVPVASELLQRFARLPARSAAVIAITVVISIGAAYEIFEWQIAVRLSPAQAEAYNGQQGDVWDPQKDMALAACGAMVSSACCFRWSVSGQ